MCFVNGVGKHYTDPLGQFSKKKSPLVGRIGWGPRLVGQLRLGPRLVRRIWSRPRLVGRLKLGPRLVGRLRLGPRLMGRLGLGVRVNASFQKNARLLGLLGSGPCLMADRADVALTHVLYKW